MRSTFHSLETARRSLFTQQTALSTVGHNIANANTEGYSRQVVNMTASRPIEAVGLMSSNAPGQLGTGVEFTSITRVREKFLDDQFRNESKSLGSWTVQSDTLDKLESIMNEPSETGIRTVLDNFWKAWSDLANNPSDVTGLKIVRENGMALAEAFNYTSKKLEDLGNDLTNNVSIKAQEINSMLTSISSLNGEIQRIEGLGNDANDLRDQRDLLTDKLSKNLNISVQETPQGYTINMGGTNLVTGQTVTPVTVDSLEDAYSTGTLNSGEVYGMFYSRDTYVADYKSQLDTLANTIANGEMQVKVPKGSVLPVGSTVTQVNSDGTYTSISITDANKEITDAEGITLLVDGLNGLQKLGFATTDTLQQGIDFFTFKTGSTEITAASITVNPIIVQDPSRIATSMRTEGTGAATKVIKGNNTLALITSELKNTNFTFPLSGGSNLKGTIDDYFGSIVGQLGVQSQEATRQLNNQNSLVTQVDGNRQSVSGVSLDEEMSNMIMFQHAYNSAARFMTTIDQILDKVINSMGVVGR
jgi:flagellar hook-associated protein 1